jgi:hypothetical protein
MKEKLFGLILFLACCLSFDEINAQKKLTYLTEAGAQVGTGDNAPFWQVSNKQGLSSIEPDNGYLRAGAFWNETLSDKFSYDAGLDLAGAVNFNAGFFIQQAYVEADYQNVFLRVGSKEHYSDFRNNLLTTGTTVWSGNARPIPQIDAGIKDYIALPFAKWMQFKGEIAFGKFTDNNYQKDTYNQYDEHYGFYTLNVMYHYKSLFVKFEEENKPVNFIFGFEMGTQFDGDPVGNEISKDDLKAGWWEVLFPFGTISSGNNQVSSSGNLLGCYHFVLGYDQPDYKLTFYNEHYFDDHTGMFFHNWKDGLFGIEYKKKQKSLFNGMVCEYVNTTNQSGPILYDKTGEVPIQVSGADNYYNNFGYPGWAHWGMAIGSPLLTSPAYNRNGYLAFENNRTRTYHLGVSGNISGDFVYRVLASYTQGWGTPYIPFIKKKTNFMGLAEVSCVPQKIPGWKVTASLGLDSGDLYGDNFGINLSIRKTGTILSK